MTGYKQFGLKVAAVVALFAAFTFMAPEAQAGGFGITLHGGDRYGGYNIGYYDRGYGGGYYGSGYGGGYYGGSGHGGGYYGGSGYGNGYYGAGHGYSGRPYYRPVYRPAYNYYRPVRHRDPWCDHHRAYHRHSRGYGYSDPYYRDSGYGYSDRYYDNDRYYDDGHRGW